MEQPRGYICGREYEHCITVDTNSRIFFLFIGLASSCYEKEVFKKQWTWLVDQTTSGISSKITQITK
jgi:hypothetical protein